MIRINLAKPVYNPAWHATGVEKDLRECDVGCDYTFTLRRALEEAYEAGQQGRYLMAPGVGI